MVNLAQRTFEELDIHRQYTIERTRGFLLMLSHLNFKP